MRDKPAQHQLATMLVAIAQAIIEGRMLVTEFTSSSNIEGCAHFDFAVIDCHMPETHERPTAAGSETLQ
jgi:hypothetical protein